MLQSLLFSTHSVTSAARHRADLEPAETVRHHGLREAPVGEAGAVTETAVLAAAKGEELPRASHDRRVAESGGHEHNARVARHAPAVLLLRM